MTKRYQAPILTLRLEPELAERLRVAAFVHRRMKQPLLRDAIKILLEREQTCPEAATQRRWRKLHADAPADTPAVLKIVEALRLSYEQHERLRKFAYNFRVHKQTVMRQALIEYLDQLDKPER